MPGEPSQSLQWLNMVTVAFGVAAILADLETLAEPFSWVGFVGCIAIASIYAEQLLKEYRNRNS